MRRTPLYLCAALVFLMLALAFSSPYSSRTVKAAQQRDKCNECLEKVAKHFNNCVAVQGENEARCYDKFNEDTIHCYATVCEQ